MEENPNLYPDRVRGDLSEGRDEEYQYLDLARDILANGKDKGDFATGNGLRSVFGRQLRYNLRDGKIPILTTKRVGWQWAAKEMLWFISGECDNIKGLADQGITIWDEWPFKKYNVARDGKDLDPNQLTFGFMKEILPELTQKEFIQKIRDNPRDSPLVKGWGNLGPIYGSQWRHWKAPDGREVDQLDWAQWKTKNYPQRKHVVVSAWNPAFTYEMANKGEEMALPPCHTFFQLYVDVEAGELSCQLYQRSADLFLGVPYNKVQYGILTHALAHVTGFKPGEFIHTFGDVHIYANHLEQVEEQLSRTPHGFPTLRILNPRSSLDEIVFEDFEVSGYNPDKIIRAPVTPVGGYNLADRDRWKN